MVGDSQRDSAIGRVADACRQPVGDFELDHHEQPLDLGSLLQDSEDHRGCDVVGKVGHERPGSERGRAQLVEVELERITENDRRLVELAALSEQLDELGIYLEAPQLGSSREQRLRERPHASSHLEHALPRSDRGQAGDARQRVGVDDEVLPKPALRPQTVALEQGSGLGAAEGHQPMVTVTAPAESGAMAWNTEVSRSMTRPGLAASRSVTRHEALAPVETLVTQTVVPIGSVGLAH